MQTLNIDLIRQLMNTQDYEKVLEHYFFALENEDEAKTILILEGIMDVLHKGVLLKSPQISQIKRNIDLFSESIQDSLIDLYFDAIRRDNAILLSEIPHCLSQLKVFDPNIRAKFLDFVIEIFPIQKESQELIIKALVGCLKDELWKTRLKVVDFFRALLKAQPKIVVPFKKQLLMMLYEPDLDVLSEILDFLLKLIKETFTQADMRELFLSLPNYQFTVQDRILWLIGKVGRSKRELIQDFLPDLIRLLDHEDNLLHKRVGEAISDIMQSDHDVFDNLFFLALKEEMIENIGDIERIMVDSIVAIGPKRFVQLYEIHSSDGKAVVHTLSNIIRKISKEQPKLLEPILSEVTHFVRNHLDQQQTDIFKQFLMYIPRYDIFLIVYKIFAETEFLLSEAAEKYRKIITDFLIEKVPQVGYTNLAKWLQQRLIEGPIKVAELGQKFNIPTTKIYDILHQLLESGLIEATIIEDTISLPKKEETVVGIKEDIILYKKWYVSADPETRTPVIIFSIKLENSAETELSNINIFFTNPEDILTLADSNQSMTQVHKSLAPKESTVMMWKFIKKYQDIEAHSSFIKMVLFYQKNGKLYSISKKLDILFL